MAIVDAYEQFESITAKGNFGFPHGYGLLFLGWSRYGYEDPKAGIYRERPSANGRILVRNKHYYKSDTPSPAQLVLRAKFASAVATWQALSPTQKMEWEYRQYPKNMSGYNRFISLWLKS
jgi:hypothetical protein